MLKIDKQRGRLVSLQGAAAGSLSERYDLGELVVNSADEFFGEIGQRLFIVGKDVRPSQEVPIPIDLLALDPRGRAVVVVLQRGREKSPLARALTCAGMIADWKPPRFTERLSREQLAELGSFLQVDVSEINRDQRAILISESYDFEDLAATKWLRERYELDNTCVRVSMAIDSHAQTEYLSATDLSKSSLPGWFELPEAASLPPPSESDAERRRKPRTSKSLGRNLTIEHDGKLHSAQLVDASDGGLGTETRMSVRTGTPVYFTGELHSPRFSMRLHGRARVAHCRPQREGVFRVGLAFEEVQVRKLEPARETKASNPLAQSPASFPENSKKSD